MQAARPGRGTLRCSTRCALTARLLPPCEAQLVDAIVGESNLGFKSFNFGINLLTKLTKTNRELHKKRETNKNQNMAMIEYDSKLPPAHEEPPHLGSENQDQAPTSPTSSTSSHSSEYYRNASQEDPIQKKKRRRTRRRARMAASAVGGLIVGVVIIGGGWGVVIGGAAGAAGARVLSKRAEKRKDAKINAALQAQAQTSPSTVY